jgi:hypothetical protein
MTEYVATRWYRAPEVMLCESLSVMIGRKWVRNGWGLLGGCPVRGAKGRMAVMKMEEGVGGVVVVPKVGGRRARRLESAMRKLCVSESER